VIDVHCHLLPNIDDGSRSVEQSAIVLGDFAKSGISDVVLTPHLAAGSIQLGGEGAVERRERALERLRVGAPALPRLALGFEIMLDQPLPVLAVGDRRFSLAGSRYYLVEFPTTIVPQFAAMVLQQMSRAGVIPIVAHPERYDACSPAVVAGWRQAGAKIQLDATTLTRPHSRGRRARALLEEGLADVLAADNHGDYRSLGAAARFLETRGAGRVVARLTEENPGAVLRDGDMLPVEAIRLTRKWTERMSGFFRE
jgi:protein-tyrosine phosphatase